MTAYHNARLRLAARTNRYEVLTYINEETCGYEVYDHKFGRVVASGDGYDGNYASRRAGDDAKEWMECPQDFVSYGVPSGRGFDTSRGDW